VSILSLFLAAKSFYLVIALLTGCFFFFEAAGAGNFEMGFATAFSYFLGCF